MTGTSYQFRPAKRENTLLTVGIAGPTKSGKTMSAHRLAVGLAQGGRVVMINTEGPKGHQYSDRFTYDATDLSAPYGPEKYTGALLAAFALTPPPAVVIIDSLSHMHNGPGGILDIHESELDRIAGQDWKKRERSTWTAWIKPKAAETAFVYAGLSAPCHLIYCFRAKEKLKIVKGQDPVNLGWQPIAGDAVSFETSFTLVLPPHSKGVPDMELSEMREPYDSIVPKGALSEATGTALARWAAGRDGKQATVDDKALEGYVAKLTSRALAVTADAAKDSRRQNIEAAREKFNGDLGAYLAWLGAQVERLEAEATAAAQESLSL